MKRTPAPLRLTPDASRSFSAFDALLLLALFSLTMHPLVDPDFGWHLRAGLDLPSHGWRMPATDPYSHTVPEWPWVEHAWLTDGLIGLLYAGLGRAGPLAVIILFGVITASAFLLAASPARASRTGRYLAVAIALSIALPFLGGRTQMVTLLGLGLVIRTVNRSLHGQNSSLWTLPPLFLLWGNLHGGFTAGLFLLGLVAVGETLKAVFSVWPASLRERILPHIQEPSLRPRQIGWLIAVTAGSALVTLLNPYGWRLHGEIYASLTDRFMLETLHEWQPLSLGHRAGLSFTIYLGALALGMAAWYRRVEPTRWLLWAVFGGLSVLHWRNIPFFLLVSVPLTAELLAGGGQRIAGRLGSSVWAKGWVVAAMLAAASFAGTVGHDLVLDAVRSGLDPAAYFQQTAYPIEAVGWIREHPRQVGSRMYNDYGLGGFLLWWLPEHKVFIDGRMPAWRVGDRRIFYDYVALTAREPPALGVLEKYRVDWAITEADSALARALAAWGSWRELYRDPKVAIYVKQGL